jgi:UDP-N-acetylmuramoyl-tripeptide--D-alanyl-D-alanine ligase
LAHLPEGGIAVFPSDDAYTYIWQQQAAGKKIMRFALQGAPDISAQAQWQDGAWQVCAQSPAGQIQYRLQIAGRHHVKNSLAALAACLGAGVPLADIAQGLEQFVAVAGRCRAVQLQWGARHLDLIDDSYNANPDSVCAAIDVLAELPGPHLLVLGDMGEVGNQGEEFHTEVGEYAAERGIETLYALGDLMRYTAAAFPGARHFANMNSLQVACLRDAPQYRSILVKGSRFMRMESVIAALQAAAQASKEEGGAYVA